MSYQITNHMQDCINHCQSVQEECLQTVQYCVDKGGEYADPDCIALLITCEAIAGASVKAMSVGSEYHTKVCKATAEICEAVVRDFEDFNDRASRHLVKVAQRCAESCREMSSTQAGSAAFRGAKGFGQYNYNRSAY